MNGSGTALVVSLYALMQILGIASACFVRICQGTSRESFGQRFFLIVLSLVGMVALASLFIGPGYWWSCSATLAFMVVVAVYNFNGGCESALD